MMNEVGRHLKRSAPDDPIPELVAPGVMVPRNHTATVHRISLRVDSTGGSSTLPCNASVRL